MTVTSLSRIGSANAFNGVVQSLENQQSSLANIQAQLTSGLKINTPSDDPVGAANAERALTRINRIAADQRALTAQQTAITTAESTLGDVTKALQSFRQLVVNAGDGAQTPSDRQTIANQLQGLRDQIFADANAKDSNGRPLFAALGSALSPFVGPQTSAPDYTFQGLPGQTASTTATIPYALDGNAAFMNEPSRDGVYNVAVTNTVNGNIPTSRTLTTGNVSVTNSAAVNGSAYTLAVTGVDSTTVPGTTTVTYDVTENPSLGNSATGLTASFPTSSTGGSFTVSAMPGLSLTITGTPAVSDTITVTPSPSLFSVLDNAISAIGTAPNNNAATQAVSQALNNIDIGAAKVSAIRGQAGELMSRADSITASNSAQTIQQQSNQSSAQDVNMVQAVSNFQNQQTSYQAALASYAQMQKLSLFNYISN